MLTETAKLNSENGNARRWPAFPEQGPKSGDGLGISHIRIAGFDSLIDTIEYGCEPIVGCQFATADSGLMRIVRSKKN